MCVCSFLLVCCLRWLCQEHYAKGRFGDDIICLKKGASCTEAGRAHPPRLQMRSRQDSRTGCQRQFPRLSIYPHFPLSKGSSTANGQNCRCEGPWQLSDASFWWKARKYCSSAECRLCHRGRAMALPSSRMTMRK